jgi:hypothetical protein
MAYATSPAVVDISPLLFSVASSAIAASAVNNWLDEGAAVIDAELAAHGYSIPVDSGASLYKKLRNMNAFYGAAMAEWSRTGGTTTAGAQTRAQQLESRFNKMLTVLCQDDLTGMGLTQTSLMYAGGISTADKDSVASDTDRPTPIFQRGMHMNVGTGTDKAG